MKMIALFSSLLLGLVMNSGCQNFRYYDPAKPHHGKDGFLNNYDNEPHGSFWRWQWERLTAPNIPEPPFHPEIAKTDTAGLQANRSVTTLTWIGHSSALFQIQGVNILLDPIFSERVSPFSFTGPKRQVALPFALKDLPPIDVVVLSHNHYDHLDLETLTSLDKMAPGKILFLVPLGNKAFLEAEGISRVQELDWWDNFSLKGLTFTFTPTQHWTSRGLWDRNQTLWGSWFISSPDFKFYFAGDSGYSKDFQDIYRKLGAVDVALIPIGAYAPRWFMKRMHVNPEEAVKIHQDLHAKLSVPIHWGTFRLSDEPMAEPPQLLKSEIAKANLAEDSFYVMKYGETLNFERRNLERK